MKHWVHTSLSDALHKNQFISENINKSIKDLSLSLSGSEGNTHRARVLTKFDTLLCLSPGPCFPGAPLGSVLSWHRMVTGEPWVVRALTRTSLVTCLWLDWLNFPPASLVTSLAQAGSHWPGLISWLTQDQNNQLQHIVCKPFQANGAKIEFKLDSMSSNHRGYRLPWLPQQHTEECSRANKAKNQSLRYLGSLLWLSRSAGHESWVKADFRQHWLRRNQSIVCSNHASITSWNILLEQEYSFPLSPLEMIFTWKQPPSPMHLAGCVHCLKCLLHIGHKFLGILHSMKRGRSSSLARCNCVRRIFPGPAEANDSPLILAMHNK